MNAQNFNQQILDIKQLHRDLMKQANNVKFWGEDGSMYFKSRAKKMRELAKKMIITQRAVKKVKGVIK